MNDRDRGPRHPLRSFRLLWVAQTLSNLGDGVSSIALAWLASLITRDPRLLALIGATGRSAWIVFALFAGALADRLDRRKAIVSSLTVQGVLMLFLTLAVARWAHLFGTPDSPIEVANAERWLIGLAALAFIMSLTEVIRDVTAQAFVVPLVTDGHLERANSRLLTTELVTGQLIGPPLGGLFIALALWIPFGFDAATFFVGALLIMAIPASGDPSPRVRSGERIRTQMGDSMRWLRAHRVLRSMTLTLAGYNFLTAFAFATFVLFVQEVIGLDATGFALISTGGAIAGVLGGVLADRVIDRVGRSRLLMLIPVVASISFLITGATSSAWVVWAAAIPSFFLGTVWSVLSRSLRQRIVPSEMLGRVTGAHRMFGFGSVPVGVALGGVAASVGEALFGREMGLRFPFGVAAVGMLLLLPNIVRNLSEAKLQAAIAS